MFALRVEVFDLANRNINNNDDAMELIHIEIFYQNR